MQPHTMVCSCTYSWPWCNQDQLAGQFPELFSPLELKLAGGGPRRSRIISANDATSLLEALARPVDAHEHDGVSRGHGTSVKAKNVATSKP